MAVLESQPWENGSDYDNVRDKIMEMFGANGRDKIMERSERDERQW